MISPRSMGFMRWMAAVRLLPGIGIALCLLVTGCPPENKSAPGGASSATTPSTVGACAKVGQSCEFTPGKLGTCVQKDDCKEAAGPCFVCQSQH